MVDEAWDPLEPDEDYASGPCDDCGREVTGEYSECPHCGADWTPAR